MGLGGEGSLSLGQYQIANVLRRPSLISDAFRSDGASWYIFRLAAVIGFQKNQSLAGLISLMQPWQSTKVGA